MKFFFPKKFKGGRSFAMLALFSLILYISIPFTLHIQGDFVSISEFISLANDDTIDGSGGPGKIARFLGNTIGEFLLYIASFLLGVSGKLLDATINFLILNMKSTAPVSAVDNLWAIVRDICNLAFIFGLLYTGLRTVFDPENAQTRRFLVSIIIGALLINFSLYIAKVIVDLGNYTALVVYNEGIRTFLPEADDGEATISGAFMNVLGASSVLGSENTSSLVNSLSNGFALFGWYLAAFLFIIITAYVFFMAAFLIIARFGTLILLLIASPLLFSATVFPQTESHAKDLWSKLFRSSFYPVIFFFLIFIALRVIVYLRESFTIQGNLGDTFADPGGANFSAVILFFALATFFVMQSIHVANKLSVTGGNWASGKVTGFRKSLQGLLGRGAGNASFGLMAAGLRRTIGQNAYKTSTDSALLDRAARGDKEAQGKLERARKRAGMSFDARNIAGMGKKAGVGEGQTGGYTGALKKKKEAEVKYARELGHDEYAVKQLEKEKEDIVKAESSENKLIKEREEKLADEQNKLKNQINPLNTQIVAKTREIESIERKIEEQNEILNNTSIITDPDKVERAQKELARQKADKDKVTNDILGIKAAVDAITESFSGSIEEAKKGVDEAKEAKKIAIKKVSEAIKEIKGSRQKAYADTVARGDGSRNFVGGEVANQAAAKEVRKTAGTDESATDKLAKEIANLEKKIKDTDDKGA